jgi:ligand-binding sensor domain-containing protein
MFKKIILLAVVVIISLNRSTAQEIGDIKFLWVHNFQFFQFDYKIGATLQGKGEHCNIWIENNLVTAIAVDISNSIVYAGTSVSGIFRKNIGESVWEIFSDGLPNSTIADGITKINDIMVTEKNNIIVATDDGIYQLSTAENKWKRRNVNGRIFCLTNSNEKVFAGLGGYIFKHKNNTGDDKDGDSDIDLNMGVFVSRDDGLTWTRQSNGLPFDNDEEYLAVLDIEASNNDVFAATEAGIFINHKGEEHWEAVEKELIASKANVKINISESKLEESEMQNIGKSFGPLYERLLAADRISREDKVVVIEFDSLDQILRKWICPANDIESTDALYLVRNIEGIVGDEGKFTIKLNFYTRDETTPFVPNYDLLRLDNFKYRGESSTATIIDPPNELLLIVTSLLDPDFEVGGKFITVTYTNNSDTLVWSAKSKTLRGLNKDKKGILLSNDNLIKGKAISNYDLLNDENIISNMKLTTSSSLVVYRIASNSDEKILYSGNEKGVYKSVNNGGFWTINGNSSTGLENEVILNLAVSSDGIVYAGTLDGIFISKDHGMSWEALTEIEKGTQIVTIVLDEDNTIYAGTVFGFFQSMDNGETWFGDNNLMGAFVSFNDVENIISSFENSTPIDPNRGIYSIITENFGEDNIPDFDKQSRLNIVLHNIHDRGEAANATSNGINGVTSVMGYIRPEDQNLIGNTNQGEYIYIDSKESSKNEKAGALAHQLFRMMMWKQDYNEERWIIEGLAYFAERMCGFPLPVAMPDFQTLTGASKVFTLISGTPLSPWAVDPDDGQIVNRQTMVSMFMTYLYENYGRDDIISKIALEPENGWKGIENALDEQKIEFADLFASWVIANAINDTTQKDSVTGARFGYKDSLYSSVLNRYMAERGLGMNYGNLFGHNASMTAYKEYTINAEYKDGLNNWASMIRYFFPDPSTQDMVKAVINYWGKDLVTGEPIYYKMNAGDKTNLRVQLIKVKEDGKKEIEDLTSTFNSENELSFNMLSKYEPNSDSTELKYHHMYVIISNQDSLGGSAKFVHVRDVTPPKIQYKVIHNPLFAEFLEIYVYSNEHIFQDVGEFEGPTVDMVYFTDSTNIEMKLFDTVLDENNKEIGYIYKGKYHLTVEGRSDLIIRKLQDLAGNNTDDIVYPIEIVKINPGSEKIIVSSDNKMNISLPVNSLKETTYMSIICEDISRPTISDKYNICENSQIISNIYQIGPVGMILEKNSRLTIEYDNRELTADEEALLNVFTYEAGSWVPITAEHDLQEHFFTISINKLGTYVILKDILPQKKENEKSHIPMTYAISQNYPNPFNLRTEINYQIPEDNKISVKIYNLNGQLIKTLINEYKTTGYYKTIWNGTTETGMIVTSGVYLCKMETDHFKAIRKMILIK